MSKGGGTSSTMDPNVVRLMTQNYTHAQDIANQPFTPYTAPLVASPSDLTQQSWNTVGSGAMDAGLGALNNATGSALNLTNFQTPQMTAATSGAYTPTPVSTAATPGLPTASTYGGASINRGDVRDLSAPTGLSQLDQYMNPYTTDVVNAALNDLNRSREIGINQNASNATLSNAFGGDRQAVTDAETNRAYADAAARTAAQLRSSGFDTAAGLLQNDLNRQLQAGSANQAADLNVAGQNAGFGQQAGLFNAGAINNTGQFNADLLRQLGISNAGMENQGAQFNASNALQNQQFNAGNEQQANVANLEALLRGAGIDLSATGLLGNLGGAQQQQFLSGANAINAAGMQQQQNQQALADAAYQQFLRQQGYPIDMQQLLNSALGLFGNARGTQSYTSPTYPLASLLGGAGQGAGSALANWALM